VRSLGGTPIVWLRPVAIVINLKRESWRGVRVEVYPWESVGGMYFTGSRHRSRVSCACATRAGCLGSGVDLRGSPSALWSRARRVIARWRLTNARPDRRRASIASAYAVVVLGPYEDDPNSVDHAPRRSVDQPAARVMSR